jgi:hypothetical protein
MENRIYHNLGEIPIELQKGDKIMILSHNKIVGVTDVKDVGKDTVILNKTHYSVGEEIPKKINSCGFIATMEVFDIFYYNSFVCDKLGFEYKKF